MTIRACTGSIDKLFGQDVTKVWAEHLAKKRTGGKRKKLKVYQQLRVDQDKCFLVVLSLQKPSEPGWNDGVIVMAPKDVKLMVGPMWDTAPLFDPDCCSRVPEAQEEDEEGCAEEEDEGSAEEDEEGCAEEDEEGSAEEG